MSKYNIYAKVVGSKFIGTVEANSEKEALESDLAADAGIQLCHQCYREVDSAEIVDLTAELAE